MDKRIKSKTKVKEEEKKNGMKNRWKENESRKLMKERGKRRKCVKGKKMIEYIYSTFYLVGIWHKVIFSGDHSTNQVSCTTNQKNAWSCWYFVFWAPQASSNKLNPAK